MSDELADNCRSVRTRSNRGVEFKEDATVSRWLRRLSPGRLVAPRSMMGRAGQMTRMRSLGRGVGIGSKASGRAIQDGQCADGAACWNRRNKHGAGRTLWELGVDQEDRGRCTFLRHEHDALCEEAPAPIRHLCMVGHFMASWAVAPSGLACAPRTARQLARPVRETGCESRSAAGKACTKQSIPSGC